MNTIYSFLRYFFQPRPGIPGSPFRFYVALFIVVGLLIAHGIFVKWKIKKFGHGNRTFKRLFGHLVEASYWFASLILLNIFGRYERFPLLGARFVLYSTLLIALYVYGKAVYKYFKIYPAEKSHFKELPAQKKYTIEKYSRK